MRTLKIRKNRLHRDVNKAMDRFNPTTGEEMAEAGAVLASFALWTMELSTNGNKDYALQLLSAAINAHSIEEETC